MNRPLSSSSVLFAVVVIVAAGCSDDESADPTQPAPQEVLEVTVDPNDGTCMLVDPTLPPKVEELPIIDCEQEHTHEIYATVAAGKQGDVYPGIAELESIAQTECLTEFDQFVGISAFDSTLTYTWLVPTLDGWNDREDFEILCVLQHKTGEKLTGSKAQSKI